MRRTLTVAAALLVAGCATAVPTVAPPSAPRARPWPTPTTPPPGVRVVPPMRSEPAPQPGFRAPQVLRVPGVQGVIEESAEALVRRFGTPRLDVHEGDSRKLQFAGEACVLDVFLYPLREGGEPVATYLEARRASDGQEVERAACVAALQGRR
ncbi:MAG: hypothetical protein B7Z08_07660 [Sphingomonadales bacterium 32-68-7]|nr:MAG: hypothetical protein B7Z33_01760 [Sphingomonadales bacterium 12-68-11]OYX08880.1 MAG: hypothetical protein B7Z08_07660 [Sphingomonadales bacterium 32-68-7]